MKIRSLMISCGLLLGMSGLVYRVVDLQILEQDFLRKQGDSRMLRVVKSSAYRGIISDRNGEPLAISTPVQSVWVNPKDCEVDKTQLRALAKILGMSVDKVVDKVDKNPQRNFVYLRRHVTPGVADQVKLLGIPGVHLTTEYRRYYPAGEISSHLLGVTNVDGVGTEGLELTLDSVLRGEGGSRKVIRDRQGHEVQILEDMHPSKPGRTVELSIDQRLQYLAYKELKKTVKIHQAKAGSAIVLDVHTGEVLAMVNQPSFNPNTSVTFHKDGRYRNRAVTDVFEPGSVMKTFSVVSALQHGKLTPTSVVDTSPGKIVVGKHVVREDKGKDYGVLDVAGILQKSSNVGVGKITLALPPEALWKTYQSLGFGRSTFSGFPGESSGVLNSPPKQPSFVLATMAFGYGLSVTPLQLAQAYATLGASGIKRPVTFIKQHKAVVGEQVLNSKIAKQVVDMLAGVVEQSAVRAKVVGYQVAGKTGTSRKIAPQGGYLKNSHVAVFAGLAPARDPRFAIVVMVDDPKNEYYGGQVAAPLFSKIASEALRLNNISPEIIDGDNWRIAQTPTIHR